MMLFNLFFRISQIKRMTISPMATSWVYLEIWLYNGLGCLHTITEVFNQQIIKEECRIWNYGYVWVYNTYPVMSHQNTELFLSKGYIIYIFISKEIAKYSDFWRLTFLSFFDGSLSLLQKIRAFFLASHQVQSLNILTLRSLNKSNLKN